MQKYEIFTIPIDVVCEGKPGFFDAFIINTKI